MDTTRQRLPSRRAGRNRILTSPSMDFGDAWETETSFPTTLANNGARHIVGSGLLLGASVDDGTNGEPDATAAGDGAEEQIFVDQTLSTGTNDLTAAIPSTATAGTAFARFRVTSTGGYSYSGLAPDGEVEDYLLTLVPASRQALREAPLATTELWTGSFVDDRDGEEAAPLKTHLNPRFLAQTPLSVTSGTVPLFGEESVSSRLTQRVVEHAVIKVASTGRNPLGSAVQLLSLDRDLVDRVFERSEWLPPDILLDG